MKKRSLPLFLLGAICLVSSCVDETENDPLEAAKENIECEYNSDCDKGLVCGQYSGKCEQCYMDSQCGEGQKCSPAGECIAQCQTDRDCSTGDCVDGVCEDGIAAGTIPEINMDDYVDGGTTGVDWLDELLNDFQDYIEEGGGGGGGGPPGWDDYYDDDDDEALDDDDWNNEDREDYIDSQRDAGE